MNRQQQQEEQDAQTTWDEVRNMILSLYRRMGEWMRPAKSHPPLLQALLFLLKLPVLLLFLLLSPVVIAVLLFVFFVVL